MQMDRYFAAAAAAAFLFSLPAGADGFDDAKRRFRKEHPNAVCVSDPQEAERCFLVRGFRTAPISGDGAAGAREFALEHRALIGLRSPSASLEWMDKASHLAKRSHRFRQTLYGLPVFNARVIVSVDGAGRIYKIASKAVLDAPKPPEARLDEHSAERAAGRGIPGVGPAAEIDLGWYAVAKEARLVYRVVAPAPGMRVFESMIDAQSGARLAVRDLYRSVRANVFPENPVVDDETTQVVDLPHVNGDVALAADGGADGEDVAGLELDGAYARAATCTNFDSYGCTSWSASAVSTANGFLDAVPLLSDPTAAPDPFSEVNGYYNLDRQNAWFREEFGYSALYGDMDDPSDKSEKLWVIVGVDFVNAFWAQSYGGTGDSVQIGQGEYPGYGLIDFSYDAEVVFHEFAHSVSSMAFNVGYGVLDNYGVDATAGSIEEGNADYFAVTHSGTSKLGEYGLPGDHGRNADNDATCPDGITGESHADSAMMSGTLWEIRETLGKEKADHLDYGALVSGPATSFDDLAALLVAEAEDNAASGDFGFTDADVATVSEILEARGVADCERVIDLWVDGGPVEKLQYSMYDITGGDGGTPSAAQYRISTDASTRTAKLLIEPWGATTYDVLMRKDAPVEFTWAAGSSVYGGSWTAAYDAIWTGSESAPLTEVELTSETAFPLEPGAAYYFSILYRSAEFDYTGCSNAVSALVSTDGPGPVEPDGGADTDSDGDTDSDTDTDADSDTDTDADGDTDTADSSDGGARDEDSDGGACDCAATGAESPTGTPLLRRLL